MFRRLFNDANFPLNCDRSWIRCKSLSGAEFIYVQPDGSRLDDLSDRATSTCRCRGTFDGDRGRSHWPRVRVERRRLSLPTARSSRSRHRTPASVVYIFYPESLLEEAIADAERPSLLGLLFGLVAVGLTFGIGQRLVGRIRALERRTRQIAAGDFSPMPLPRRTTNCAI